jgi:hypothetical protein
MTERGTVSRVVIEMTAPETRWTVVAVGGAGGIKRDVEPAVDAPEGPPAAVVMATRQRSDLSGAIG